MIRRRTSSCTRRGGSSRGVCRVDLGDDVADQRHRGDVVEREQIGAQAVVDVVRVVGDVVGDRRHLRLGAGEGRKLERLQPVVGQDRPRHAVRGVARRRLAVAREQRAVVLDQALQRLPGEIEAVEAGVAALEIGDDAQRLRIVVEAAVILDAGVERALAGVAERRMAEIVRQRQSLGEVLVEAERAGQRPGDLDHFQRVGQPGAVMVAFVVDEDLRLVRQAPERGGMDDAVAIAAEIVARAAVRLGKAPAAARQRIGGERRPRDGGGNGHL